jgi:hypothetical protein
LNALVNRIVCAVGLREAVDAPWVLLVAAVLPFVLLLEPAIFGLLLPDFPVEAVLLLAVGFFVCSAAGVELCIRPVTPAPADGTVNATKMAIATPPRNLSQISVTISLFFEPTYPL